MTQTAPHIGIGRKFMRAIGDQLFAMNFDEPVRLDWTPPADYVELLSTLHHDGLEDPVLHGGSLREAFMKVNAHKYGPAKRGGDFDIIFSHNHFLHRMHTIHSTMTGKISISTIWDAGIGLGMPIVAGDPKACYYQVQGVGGRYENQTDMDVFRKVVREPLAPINAIAMNRHGEVWVHKRFTEHAEKKIYKPRWNATEYELRVCLEHFAKVRDAHHADLEYVDPRLNYPECVRRLGCLVFWPKI